MKFVSSMTGFGAAEQSSSAGLLSVELRSVNSRFLDLTLRLPDDLRETIAASVNRGKMECRIGLRRQPGTATPRLNAEALAQLMQLQRDVLQAAPAAQPLRAADILTWENVVEGAIADPEALREALVSTLNRALDVFHQTRQREGAALRDGLLERCTGIDVIVTQLRERAPGMLAAIERKLTERLNQALTPALGATLGRDEIADRIRQEVTLYGLRADVDEELNRLATHVTEVRRVLAAGGAVGRRLDFLMQELNREANTLGSKATAIDLTNAAVELKLLIEQMREQIQNLE
jgi:uncharacterized protein (TIGR00255 family)